jgi:hypothetical protein
METSLPFSFNLICLVCFVFVFAFLELWFVVKPSQDNTQVIGTLSHTISCELLERSTFDFWVCTRRCYQVSTATGGNNIYESVPPDWEGWLVFGDLAGSWT